MKCCKETGLLQAPFHAAYLNAVFGNVYDQKDTLLSTALLLKPGQSFLTLPCSAAAIRCHAPL